MAQAVLKRKIVFDMEIENVSQLTDVYSDTFVIRGFEWKFKIEKIVACEAKNQMEDKIGVQLQCDIPNELNDYMCGALAKIKLVSLKDDKKSTLKCISEVFDAENVEWPIPFFIGWKELIDNGCVRDDTILFEIELRVGPLERADCSSLTIKTIEDKYKGKDVTAKLIKLTLNKIDESFIAAKSEKFKFNGLLWHIVIGKVVENEQDYLSFMLNFDNKSVPDDWSCELSAMVNPSARKPCGKNFGELTKNSRRGAEIAWPRSVKNGSFEAMLELEVKESTSAALSLVSEVNNDAIKYFKGEI